MSSIEVTLGPYLYINTGTVEGQGCEIDNIIDPKRYLAEPEYK